ncbi:MAG: hypothetical protein R6V60_07595, partial [Desulfobacterales bacterium]
AIKRTNIPVKNIQAKRVYVFQAIRVNEDFCNVFRQFFYGIDKLICRRRVEVAHQLQAEAFAFFFDGNFEI